MGLPGSGKTTLAAVLASHLSAFWINADEIRNQYNDWDFSEAGRLRQSQRMRTLCDLSPLTFQVADFVAPIPEMRKIFAADYTIWVDTIKSGRYEDTNKLFVPPFEDEYDFRIKQQNAKIWGRAIAEIILEDCSE